MQDDTPARNEDDDHEGEHQGEHQATTTTSSTARCPPQLPAEVVAAAPTSIVWVLAGSSKTFWK